MEINNQIVEKIKKANIEAFKAKDTVARNMYSVLLNKIMMENIKKRERGEQLNDAEVFQILQKFVKELLEEKEGFVKANKLDGIADYDRQIEIVKTYLPQMMNKEEIKAEILKLEDKSVPSVMKHFKTNFAGKCDMREVQEVLKTV